MKPKWDDSDDGVPENDENSRKPNRMKSKKMLRDVVVKMNEGIDIDSIEEMFDEMDQK